MSRITIASITACCALLGSVCWAEEFATAEDVEGLVKKAVAR